MRFLFASRPEGMGRVLGIVYRCIATHLVRKGGFSRKMAQTGAVTLIERFGSALNLNVHLHMLFLDGVYVERPEGTLRFRWVKAPSSAELVRLTQTLAECIGRYLERQGLVERAVAELTSKVYGYGHDVIRIREQINLNGANARGLIKTRVAAREDATAEVIGATCGNAPGARGHVDCLEIVRDRAVVSAIPEVKVTHPLAKVTHEAAIGSVDGQQLETLMARGLDPEQAVDLIIKGMLS